MNNFIIGSEQTCQCYQPLPSAHPRAHLIMFVSEPAQPMSSIIHHLTSIISQTCSSHISETTIQYHGKNPPEIFSEIIKNLDGPLASYSTISRDWQCHIEARTMAEIHVRSDDAGQLDTIFQDSRRRSLLKTLIYEIILPSYNPLRWSKVPGRRECLKNNIAFTHDLRNLFTKLRTYD